MWNWTGKKWKIWDIRARPGSDEWKSAGAARGRNGEKRRAADFRSLGGRGRARPRTECKFSENPRARGHGHQRRILRMIISYTTWCNLLLCRVSCTRVTGGRRGPRKARAEDAVNHSRGIYIIKMKKWKKCGRFVRRRWVPSRVTCRQDARRGHRAESSE